MESIITAYGINFEHFKDLVLTHSLIVSGSVALAGYMKQNDIEPNFTPNDIDIFMCGDINAVCEFMKRYGYEESETIYDTSCDYMSNIIDVYTLENGNKQIQLILVNEPKQYMANNFDISVCVSWWNPVRNVFETYDPYTSCQMNMYLLNDNPSEATMSRIYKYRIRGFKLIELPCQFINSPDNRELLFAQAFDNLEACNIFTLEDTSVRAFLYESDWNIVIKAGEQFYAFNRKHLLEYMEGKSIRADTSIGIVYDTPLNHTITLEAYHTLKYSDYSIFELKSAYSIDLPNSKHKSLFHMYCYSVNDWLNNKCHKKISPVYSV